MHTAPRKQASPTLGDERSSEDAYNPFKSQPAPANRHSTGIVMAPSFAASFIDDELDNPMLREPNFNKSKSFHLGASRKPPPMNSSPPPRGQKSSTRNNFSDLMQTALSGSAGLGATNQSGFATEVKIGKTSESGSQQAAMFNPFKQRS